MDYKNVAKGVSEAFGGTSKATSVASGKNSNVAVKFNEISDENCKDSKKFDKEKFSDCVKNIDAYLFRYKKGAQDKFGVDNNLHVGIMAQELEKNPVTAPAVETKEDGHKEVDIKELTTENTALIADIVRRIEKLEKMMEGK